jgi:hypothetical protein
MNVLNSKERGMGLNASCCPLLSLPHPSYIRFAMKRCNFFKKGDREGK